MALHSGSYQLRQGPVQDFVIEAWKGRGSENFTVDGYRFHRFDYDARSDDQNRITNPGCLYEGALVRVAHRGDQILRIELAVPTGTEPACKSDLLPGLKAGKPDP